MPYSAFIQFFSCFQVCYFHDEYQYSAIKVDNFRKLEEQLKAEGSIEKELQSVLINLRITKRGIYYFSLNQFNKRFFFETSKYKYSDMIFILYEIDGQNNVIYKSAAMKKKKENWFKYDCKPGRYVLEIRPYFNSFLKQFTVNVYGPKTVPMTHATFQDYRKNDQNSIILEGIERLARTSKNVNIKQIGEKRMSYSMRDTHEGIGYILFNNEEPGYELTVTADLTKCKGIKILSPTPDQKITLIVPQNTKRVIIYIADFLPYSVSARFSFSWKRQKIKDTEKDNIRKSSKIRSWNRTRRKNNNNHNNFNKNLFNFEDLDNNEILNNGYIFNDKPNLPQDNKNPKEKNFTKKNYSNHHRKKSLNKKTEYKKPYKNGKSVNKRSNKNLARISNFKNKNKIPEQKRSSQQIFGGIKIKDKFFGGENKKRRYTENSGTIIDPLEQVKRFNQVKKEDLPKYPDYGVVGNIVIDMIKFLKDDKEDKKPIHQYGIKQNRKSLEPNRDSFSNGNPLIRNRSSSNLKVLLSLI